MVLLLILCVFTCKPALAQEPPVLHGVSPAEGHPGEALQLFLDGDGFLQLGKLVKVSIARVQIPFSNYSVDNNQTIQVLLRIPEGIPTGAQKISFLFEDEFGFEAPFTVLGPTETNPQSPLLYGVSPQEGHPGEQIPITLDAQDLSPLGDLQAVHINEVEAQVLDYNLAPGQTPQVLVRVPPEAPLGEGAIDFTFENGDLATYFVVIPAEAPPPEAPVPISFRGISPPEGQVESELWLHLEGENLAQLGGLQAVQIDGSDLPVFDYRALSDQAIEVLVQIPADAPTGDGQMAFFFDNFRSDRAPGAGRSSTRGFPS
jgi:hypothetical protein